VEAPRRFLSAPASIRWTSQNMDKPKEGTSEDYFRQIIVGVLIVLITLVLYAIYRRTKQVRRGILLTGLCDSGKTLLYARLVYKKFVNTQTSIKENISSYYVNGSFLRVVDIPGHERLRDKFFETYKGITRGIVYVIDSQTIQKDVRDVAEFLYNILSDAVVAKNKPYLLVLCNKQDQPLVKGCNAIKLILEKEINTLRITKSSQLESVDPKSKKSASLGKDDEQFTFDSLPCKVDFVQAYATDKNKECKITDLENWLAKIS